MTPTTAHSASAADKRQRPLGALSDLVVDTLPVAYGKFKHELATGNTGAAMATYTDLRDQALAASVPAAVLAQAFADPEEVASETLETKAVRKLGRNAAVLDLRMISHALNDMASALHIGLTTSNVLLDRLTEMAGRLGAESTDEQDVLELTLDRLICNNSNPKGDPRGLSAAMKQDIVDAHGRSLVYVKEDIGMYRALAEAFPQPRYEQPYRYQAPTASAPRTATGW